jgi:hypothetical protein
MVDWSDKKDSRFSNPALPFKVLYLAPSKITGFWERFGEELRDQEPDCRFLSKAEIAERVWKQCSLTVTQPARLLDVRSAEVLRTLGADASTFLSTYDVTQAWAEALMNHPSDIDGIIYNSRLDAPKECVAVFGKPRFVSDPNFLSVKLSPPHPITDTALIAALFAADVDLR